MARDKEKDDKMFNCSQGYESDYVVGLYPMAHRSSIRAFISDSCQNGLIDNSTHKEVYELIRAKFGLAIPVSV